MIVHIWFNLIMIHAGHLYWISSFETLEECQAQEAWYESQDEYKSDKFFCPFVEVKKT